MTNKPKVEVVKPKRKYTRKPKNDLVVQGKQSVEFLIAQAIDKGTPVETMEKIIELSERVKANQAKEAFDVAMAKFQSECPVIKKSTAGGQTKGGQVAYYYASLDSIVSQVKEILSNNGFSYSIKTETKERSVKSTCIARHILGHSESSDMEVPLGQGTNIMSAPQITASSITFAKRYAFCNVFGIMTGDDDNDAKPDNNVPPTPTPAPQPQPKSDVGQYGEPVQADEPFGDKPEDAPRPTDNTPINLKCSDCGLPISQAEKSYSEQNFGMVLGRCCQGKYRKKA